MGGPISVGMSKVSMISLTPIGSPCSGPREPTRSSARACASAASGSKLTQALITESWSAMRARQARATASQVNVPAAMPRTISVAESSLRCADAVTRPLLCGGGGDATMRLRPAGGVMHELLDFGEHLRLELVRRLGDPQPVPPRRERVHGDAEVAEDFWPLGIDVVEEEHEDVVDLGAGMAQGVAEVDLAAPVGGEVLDEEDAVALGEIALDLSVAAEAFRFLAHIEHRQ